MRAHPDDEGIRRPCIFFMLSADFVRQFSGKSLPFFQELRDKFTVDEPLVKVSFDYADVVKGTHIETTLAVSHRWMRPDDPDPDGEQLKALKGFLNSTAGKKIERVWIDSACMPQDHPKGSRSAEDAAAFKGMLAEVNRLYLGTTVLILLDLSYVSRFWTQFESWMSMQFATPDGLKPAVGTKNERHHIVCIQNAASQATLYTKALVDNWADQTPQQAHAFLSKPDVTVTNENDKEGQLPKIKALDATVQAAFGGIARRLEDELTASEAAAARAEAELTAWETENDAKAGAGHRLKVAALQTASAVAAARKAKQEHARAIAVGVIPSLMERKGASAEVDEAGRPRCSVVLAMCLLVLPLYVAGCIAPLVALTRCGTDAMKAAAARALGGLALKNADNKVAIAKGGGIAPLVALARDGTDWQKEEAAGALANLAENADNRVAIAKAGGVAPLVALARDGTDGVGQPVAVRVGVHGVGDAVLDAVAVRVGGALYGVDGQKEMATVALGNLAHNPNNQVEIARAGGIAPLVALVRNGTDGQKVCAAWTLANLACNNADNKVAIAEAGGIAPLVTLVTLARDGTENQKEYTAAMLVRLARDNADNRVAIAKAGGIAPLVALVRDGTDGQKEWATCALAFLACDNADNRVAIAKAGGNADNQVAIAKAGGLAPLVALARDGTDAQKQIAAVALGNLAYNADNKVAIAEAGGIAPLVALARGGTEKQKEEAAWTLRKLADNADIKVAIAKAGFQP